MKRINKKIHLSIPVLIVGFIILGLRSATHAPSNNPVEQTPIVQLNPHTTQKPFAPETSRTPKTKKSNKELFATTSPTLRANPKAPEIPYYLLSAVNDPFFSDNWSLTNTQATRGWDLSTGSSNVTVAVIDTGFALNHEDLTGKWATNLGETGSTQNGDPCWNGSSADKTKNNCDDDSNGYVDDWRGYDFYNIDNSPQAGEVNPSGDGTDHATMVSGVIAATANNNKGSAGIDQNAKIMPLQVFSDDADAYTSDIVAAVDYAADNGANIINLSLGTNQYDAILRTAIKRAINLGVLVVAASGNCALNDDPICNNLATPGRMTYPALYNEVVAVGATTQGGARANFSSYGPELDLVAPGNSVGPMPIYVSDGSNNNYATASGTSFSSPLVAGIAALLKAQNPSATPAQLDNLLTSSADKLSGMNGNNYSYEFGTGQVNAHKATLLGLAYTQSNLLGSDELSPRQPAIGHIWRAYGGNIASDEYVLVGCRVVSASVCSASIENGAFYSFASTSGGEKAESLQYVFIKGNSAPSGTWKIAIHNNEYATLVENLNR